MPMPRKPTQTAMDGGPGQCPEAPTDSLWQQYTRTANAAFAMRRNEAARAHYEDALCLAERLLHQAEAGGGPSQAAAIFVISHHNLAELALAMGRQGDATDHYRSAFDGLLALAGKQSAPQGLRQSCAAHLQAATVALAHHLQFCGAPARTIAKEITRARNTVLGPRGRPC